MNKPLDHEILNSFNNVDKGYTTNITFSEANVFMCTKEYKDSLYRNIQMENHLDEALTIIQEECGEVIQEVCKVKRFGLDSSHLGKLQRDKLKKELGDLYAMFYILQKMNFITEGELNTYTYEKLEKLKKYSNLLND